MAQFLNEHGYMAEALEGGFDEWEKAGYATEPK